MLSNLFVDLSDLSGKGQLLQMISDVFYMQTFSNSGSRRTDITAINIFRYFSKPLQARQRFVNILFLNTTKQSLKKPSGTLDITCHID